MNELSRILLEPLRYEFIQRALIAAVMVGISCGLIGSYIMLRRLSLIGDALAHAVLPGVVIGFMVAGKSPLSLFIGASVAGILTALLISFVERNSKVKGDTAIGIIFTGAFALGILLVSQLKQVHIDLSSYLFGDVLGVSDSDIVMSSVIALFILIVVILFYKQFLVTTFDPTLAHIIGISAGAFHYFLMTMLSMSIVAGLQSVGVILIIAMLITPPATAFLLTDRLKLMLVISTLCGIFSSVAGLYLSYHFNFASGASIVLVAVTLFMLTFLFSPKEGILVRSLRKKKAAKANLREDILKIIFSSEGTVSSEKLAEVVREKLGLKAAALSKALKKLSQTGLAYGENGNVALTDKGRTLARKLVRSHRLWETYLKDKSVVGIENVHEDAERYEHLLTEELNREIDEELGFPEKDPHGSPIPKEEDKN